MKKEKIIIALVSAAFAAILYLLLPVEWGKYNLKLEGDEKQFSLQVYAYSDLDGDGESEDIRYKKFSPVPAITVAKANGEIVNQWNLNGEWLNRTKMNIADYDHDGFGEIVTFTYYHDSIWLHVIEPLQQDGTSIHLPVDRVELHNSNQDWQVHFGRAEDLNGDGFDEYYFVIRAGFTLKPRRLYIFDVHREELLTHDAVLGNIISSPVSIDIDQDGIPEITGKVSAVGNFENKPAFISDTCSWLLQRFNDMQPDGIMIVGKCDNLPKTIMVIISNVHLSAIEPFTVQVGIPEITGKVSAVGNFENKPAFISDTCSWLLIYDQNLRFKTEPVAYSGSHSYLKVLPLQKENRQLLVSCFHSKENGKITNLIEVWEWVNDSLQTIARKDIRSDSHIQLINIDQENDGEFFIADKDHVYRLDYLLEEQSRTEVEEMLTTDRYFPMDINGDGLSEHIFYSPFSKLTVFQSDFRYGVEIDLGYMEFDPVISNFTKGRTHYLNVYRGYENQQLSYSKNPFYPFRFLIPFLAFLAYYFILTLLLGFQKRRIESRLSLEKQVMHYQLTNVVQQLDPHFLFNALNSISSYYHIGKHEHAQSYLAKVSNLVRTTLEHSERMTISLAEEISFVGDYLSVEKIRMGARLNFSIDVDETVDQDIQVPKMVIQNFVENAVKHGLVHLKERKGMIRISASSKAGHLLIVVEDNGIGRERARNRRSNGTGNGLKMVQKTLDIFEKLKKIRIVFQIEDLYEDLHEDLHEDSRHPIGTKVTLKIPLS